MQQCNWHVLVRGVLSTAAVTMGNPDCWQVENFAKAVVGQGSCQIRQDVGCALRAVFQRGGDKINPRIVGVYPRGLKSDFIGGDNVDLMKSFAVQMPAQRWHDAVGVSPYHESQLTGRAGMAGYSVDGCVWHTAFHRENGE